MKLAIKVCIIYLIFGATWILLSAFYLDFAFNQSLISREAMGIIEISKGIIYVLITAFILFFYLSRILSKLEDSEVHYKMLFNENPIPMWIYDSQTLKFLAVNRSAAFSYGYSESEFLNMTILDIRPEEEKKGFSEFVINRDKTVIDRGIWLHRTKSDEVFLVDIHCNPIKYYSRDARLVIALNIHEKLLSEQKNFELLAKTKNQSQSLKEIAWTQSHKMRAPIANILGLIQIINSENPTDPLNEEILKNLKKVALELDKVILEIVNKSHASYDI